MKEKITHIFFDLDHTLWDFETNAKQTITEVFDELNLYRFIPNIEKFMARYKVLNIHYWAMFNRGEISGDDLRFARIRHVFQTFGLEDEQLAKQFVEYFMVEGPRKKALMPHALEVVRQLAENYQLAIITNGFDETQFTKLDVTGLKPYFKHVITSETFGVRKPNKLIFEKSLQHCNAVKGSSIMIGDDLQNDYIAAKKAGLHALFFHPENSVKKFNKKNLQKVNVEEEINCLRLIPSKIE